MVGLNCQNLGTKVDGLSGVNGQIFDTKVDVLVGVSDQILDGGDEDFI